MTIMSVLLSPGKNEHVKLRARDKSIFGKLRDEMTGVKRVLSFKLYLNGKKRICPVTLVAHFLPYRERCEDCVEDDHERKLTII